MDGRGRASGACRVLVLRAFARLSAAVQGRGEEGGKLLLSPLILDADGSWDRMKSGYCMGSDKYRREVRCESPGPVGWWEVAVALVPGAGEAFLRAAQEAAPVRGSDDVPVPHGEGSVFCGRVPDLPGPEKSRTTVMSMTHIRVNGVVET